MAKEINFFEQEIEQAAPDDEDIVIENTPKKAPEISQTAPPSPKAPKPTYVQQSLPGVLEKMHIVQEDKYKERHMRQQIKRIIEALLFTSSTPIGFNKLREVADTFHPLRPRALRDIILELQHEYLSQQRAFRLEEIAQGFILRTCEEYGPYIDQMYRNKRTEKLSHAAAEVLAIIAYKQPITRPQIDAIRGVDSSGTLQNLLERQLIEPVGRLEAPGRPTLYGITNDFLQHFGMRDLKELPPLEQQSKQT